MAFVVHWQYHFSSPSFLSEINRVVSVTGLTKKEAKKLTGISNVALVGRLKSLIFHLVRKSCLILSTLIPVTCLKEHLVSVFAPKAILRNGAIRIALAIPRGTSSRKISAHMKCFQPTFDARSRPVFASALLSCERIQ